jgi:hypothetical protein
MPDLVGIDKAVTEINTQTLPEVIAAANALMSRLEALVGKLQGAKITIVVELGGGAI